jgi:hypothetical protein
MADLGPWLWAEVRRLARAEAREAVLDYNPDLTRAQGPLPGAALIAHASTHHSGGSDPLSLGSLDGTVGPPHGGTGLTSYTTGDLLYASGASALAKLAGVATGNALISGGVATAPSWGKIGLTTHVSGTLPPPNGGTGLASYATGDLLYASNATTLAALAGVATGNALISGGVGAAPSWGKINLASGGHVTGILPPGNGGTGVDNSSRTLTIATNSGTLAFSSASLTLTIPATGTATLGTGTSGEVAFWNGTNTVTSDGALLWNNTAKRLGIGVTGTIRTALQVNSSLAVSNYDFLVDYAAPTTGLLMASNNGSAWIRIAALAANTSDDTYVNFTIAGGTNWAIGADNGDSDKFKIVNNGSFAGVNEYFAIDTSGNVGVGHASPAVLLHLAKTSNLNSTAQEILRIDHNTSGTPAAGYGARLLYRLESSTTADQDAVALDAIWNVATHASRSAYLSIKVASTGLTEVARFDKPTGAGQTALLLFDVDNATVERVTVGAADSGGAGFKVLRIAN